MSSTVNGGIVTLPCGEIDVNALTANGTPTGTTSTINGGIDIAAGAVCTTLGAMSNADIWTAQINGGISITGTYSAGDIPFICHNQIKGNVSEAAARVHYSSSTPRSPLSNCLPPSGEHCRPSNNPH